MAVLDHNVQDLEDIKQMKHGQSPLLKHNVGCENEEDLKVIRNREDEYLRRI